MPKPTSKGKARAKKPKAFRLLDLPAEIRLRIYEFVLRADRTVDLGAYNHHKIAPLFTLFFASRQLHDEASRVFYGINAFRIFSTDGKFIHSKKPLLSRFPSTYRSAITTIELRLGAGWTKPPTAWGVKDVLGLPDCTSLRLLKVFVELDPEDSAICREWLSTRTSYTDFSIGHVVDILAAVPSMKEVRFDGFPSVRKSGPLMRAMLVICANKGLKISYGPYRGWAHEKEPEAIPGSSKEMSLLGRSLSHMLIGSPAF